MFIYRLTKINSSNSGTQNFNTTDSNLVFGLRPPKKVRLFDTKKPNVQVFGRQKLTLVTAVPKILTLQIAT